MGDLAALEVVDENTENDYAGWLRSRQAGTNEGADAGCRDDNNGIFKDSDRQGQNCEAAANFCQDKTHGTMARWYCPKTCGLCPKPTPSLQQADVELDDAVAGKAAVHHGAWTLTPTAA